MDRKLKRRSDRKEYEKRERAWFLKMLCLMLFIMVMLVFGGTGRKPVRTFGTMKPVVWKWSPNQAVLASRLGVVVKDPWDMVPGDLTRGRLIYNLLTKTGYRYLALDGVVMVAALLLLARGVGLVYTWQKHQVQRMVSVTREAAANGLAVEIAGTVRIAAKRGTIYVSSLPGGAEPRESYSFIIRVAPIKLAVSC